MEWTIPPDTAKTVVQSTANMKLTVPAGSTPKFHSVFIMGPRIIIF